MHLLKVTIAATNTAQRIIPASVVPANSASYSIFNCQNNGANNMWLGDSTVAANNGILIFPTGSFTATPALQYTGDLTEFYVYGTQNDILNIMIFD